MKSRDKGKKQRRQNIQTTNRLHNQIVDCGVDRLSARLVLSTSLHFYFHHPLLNVLQPAIPFLGPCDQVGRPLTRSGRLASHAMRVRPMRPLSCDCGAAGELLIFRFFLCRVTFGLQAPKPPSTRPRRLRTNSESLRFSFFSMLLFFFDATSSPCTGPILAPSHEDTLAPAAAT